jgi:hypothetical protein
LFTSNSQESKDKLKKAARQLAVATAIYGLGFTSSFVAMLIPMSRLEHPKPIVTVLLVPPSFVVFLAPLWSVQWATMILGQGMISIFGDEPFGSIFLVGTLVCLAILLFVLSLP